jgi:hypothetical protein
MDTLKMGYIYYREVNPRVLMAYFLEKGKVEYQLSKKINPILYSILLFFNFGNEKIEVEIENRKLNLSNKSINELKFLSEVREKLKKEFPFKNNFLYISLGVLIPLYLYFIFNCGSQDDIFFSLFFLFQFIVYYQFSRFVFNWFRYVIIAVMLFIFINVIITGAVDFTCSLYPIVLMIIISILVSNYLIKDNYLEEVIGYRNYLETLNFETLKEMYEKDNQILDRLFPYAVLFNIKKLLEIYKSIDYVVPACNHKIDCLEIFEKAVEDAFSVKVAVRIG